jgi:hypothetical protein
VILERANTELQNAASGAKTNKLKSHLINKKAQEIEVYLFLFIKSSNLNFTWIFFVREDDVVNTPLDERRNIVRKDDATFNQ